MHLNSFDLDVLQQVEAKRIKGVKKVALAYMYLAMLGVLIDIIIGAPTYLIVVFSVGSLMSFVLSIFATKKHVRKVERALVLLGSIVVLGISLGDKVVLCITFYVPLLVFLGFIEKDPIWRKSLLLFIGICFLTSYFLMSDDFINQLDKSVILIGAIDICIICIIVAITIRFFVGLNYFAYNLAKDADREATAHLLEAIETKDRLQAQQEIYMIAKQSDTEAVKLHRKRRSVLSARKEELEQFAYAASHDLKEPVRTIKSFIQVVRKRLPKGLEKKLNIDVYFDLVSISTSAMHKLLEGLLEYSRSSRLSLVPKSINVEEELNLILAKHSDLTFHLNVPLHVRTYVDPEAFKKIVEEIISNAQKFKSPSAEPVLNIEVLAKAPHLNVDANAPQVAEIGKQDEAIQIRFSDNGIGIAVEYQHQVFQLFQRLHKREEYDGAGIGLTLARMLSEKSNGSIWIESVQEGGTCVCIELPNYPSGLSTVE